MSTVLAGERNPIPDDDAARVSALRLLDVLDQPQREDLNSLARLAAYVCDTPTAVINLIDADRQWPAAAHGYLPEQADRADSMCATSIMSSDVSYTPDASKDARWATSPFMTGPLGDIRLYAAAPLTLPGGETVGTVCAFSTDTGDLSRLQLERLRDIADQAVRMLELRRATDLLGHAATRDPLTGLPNRDLFDESLRLAMAKYHRGESVPAVAFLDLDDFKVVNDTHGHAVGDELLRAVASRLLRTVRASDLLARIGGDELVILCDAKPNGRGGHDADALVTRLRRAFAEPFELSCGRIRVGASIGLAVADRDSGLDLLTRADAAMYADKRARKG